MGSFNDAHVEDTKRALQIRGARVKRVEIVLGENVGGPDCLVDGGCKKGRKEMRVSGDKRRIMCIEKVFKSN